MHDVSYNTSSLTALLHYFVKLETGLMLSSVWYRRCRHNHYFARKTTTSVSRDDSYRTWILATGPRFGLFFFV